MKHRRGYIPQTRIRTLQVSSSSTQAAALTDRAIVLPPISCDSPWLLDADRTCQGQRSGMCWYHDIPLMRVSTAFLFVRVQGLGSSIDPYSSGCCCCGGPSKVDSGAPDCHHGIAQALGHFTGTFSTVLRCRILVSSSALCVGALTRALS